MVRHLLEWNTLDGDSFIKVMGIRHGRAVRGSLF